MSKKMMLHILDIEAKMDDGLQVIVMSLIQHLKLLKDIKFLWLNLFWNLSWCSGISSVFNGRKQNKTKNPRPSWSRK